MERVASRFEEQLDIRSFVRVRSHFDALIRLLLSDEQRLLFRLQRRHSLILPTKKTQCASSDDTSDNLGTTGARR